MMKSLILSVLVFGSAGALVASDVMVPSFKLQSDVSFLPELSLQGMTTGSSSRNSGVSFAPNSRPPKFIASMMLAKAADKFVHAPRGDVDYKLIVKAPDASVDYKLKVVEIPALGIEAK